MVSALLYLQYHSIKNRLVGSLKRLKQPKYLIFALVGGSYFYFNFFRWTFSMRAQRPNVFGIATPETAALFESLGALILFGVVLLAWILPHERAALAFTEAEIAFLFPAPISRRGLIHFKLLRSQMAIFFSTLILTLVTNRAGGHAWIRAGGWWLVLSTLNLHFLGSSFARTRLLDRGITNWYRRLAIFGFLIICLGTVLVWLKRTFPTLRASDLQDLETIKSYIQKALVAGPLPYLLFPFRLVVRPFLAPGPSAFVVAMAPVLLVLGLHYWWVVRSNIAFEEASVEASRRIAEKVAAMRSGNWQAASKRFKGRRPPFVLRPNGAPFVALLWKNLISAGQAFSLRIWLVLLSMAIMLSIVMRQSAGAANFAQVLGFIAAALILWSLLIGPQFLRQDLRQDLPQADMLKLYPLRGWQLVLGELLAPAAILTAIQWFLLLVAVALLSQSTVTDFGWATYSLLGLGVALALPVLNLITLQIPNASVLLFPAWVQTGKQGPHGVEATGQRLVFLLGQLVAFVVALIPAGIAFAITFVIGKAIVGMMLGLFAALMMGTLVLAVEAGLGLLLLGWLFERFDLTAT